MLIGSKLPPLRTDQTYFSSGRAAFAYLVGQAIKPRKVYLPTFTCWSLVSTMEKRFQDIDLEFYDVDRDLNCTYPAGIEKDELFVFIHYFGYANNQELPPSEGTILEDVSHAYMSQIPARGDILFGSYRKILKIADGGFIRKFYNPIYEPSRKLDCWLRLEARDWRDVREAENMIDREWRISDMNSQSLAIALTVNEELIRIQRQKNNNFLDANLGVGKAHLKFRETECPLIHNRLFESKEERDSLRSFLAGKGVFTSIHWPTHELVKKHARNSADCMWLEDHVISFPCSHDYNVNDMEFICEQVAEWKKANGR